MTMDGRSPAGSLRRLSVGAALASAVVALQLLLAVNSSPPTAVDTAFAQPVCGFPGLPPCTPTPTPPATATHTPGATATSIPPTATTAATAPAVATETPAPTGTTTAASATALRAATPVATQAGATPGPTSAIQTLAPTAVAPTLTPGFSFALIGDIPYTVADEPRYFALISALNTADLAFVVHDGNFKVDKVDSLRPDILRPDCSDENTQIVLDGFQRFPHALIYTPGDNDWTDCWPGRGTPEGWDPLERLAKLREMFFAGNQSLGQRTIPLTRQSADPSFAEYRENARWTYGEITFATLHVVGSNNNLGRTPEMDVEWEARNTANVAWLHQAFEQARSSNSRGVMLTWQADPGFELPPDQRTAFNDLLAALEEETVAFVKPVVLVHGDTLYFRIDKPLPASVQLGGPERLPSFTRVETFGSPNVHWIEVTVDYADPSLFVFKQRIVD